MKTENRNKIQKVFLTVANADIRPFHRDWLLTRILCEFKIKRLEVSTRVASTVNDSERRNRWNDSATGTSSPALSLSPWLCRGLCRGRSCVRNHAALSPPQQSPPPEAEATLGWTQAGRAHPRPLHFSCYVGDSTPPAGSGDEGARQMDVSP